MASYVKVTDGSAELYTLGRLRKDHPNVSFPRDMTPEIAAAYGLEPLTVEPRPTYDREHPAA